MLIDTMVVIIVTTTTGSLVAVMRIITVQTAISMGITVITNTHIPMSIKLIMHIRVIISNILHDVLFHLSYIVGPCMGYLFVVVFSYTVRYG